MLCDTFNAKERFEVLHNNKDMIKLVGGPLPCVSTPLLRLMRHHTTKIHTGENPYKCNVCNYSAIT